MKLNFSRTSGVVALVVMTAVTGAEAQGSKLVFGEGVKLCGVWKQERQMTAFKRALLSQWVAGYLSGQNVESQSADFLVGTNFEGIMARVDNYCRSHPLDSVADAAFHLANELKSRAAP